MSSWSFADAVRSWNYFFFSDGAKALRCKVQDFVDTETMLIAAFDDLTARKITLADS